MDEEHLAAVEAGFAPDDPVVVAAVVRVRSELVALGKVHGRTARRCCAGAIGR